MKALVTIFVCLFSSAVFTVFSQSVSFSFKGDFEEHAFLSKCPERILFASDSNADEVKYNSYLEEKMKLIERLKRIRDRKSEFWMLRSMFYTLHRSHLRKYSIYQSYFDLIDKGSYDCLTGTALFANFLDDLGMNYTINEFDFHSNISVNLGDQSILLEPTDPIDGFVTDAEEIAKRIRFYKGQAKSVPSTPTDHQPLQNAIGVTELAGLHYFNLAAARFNAGDYFEAFQLIQKARVLYPSSERIVDMQRVFSSRVLLAQQN